MLDRKIIALDIGCRWDFAEDFLAEAENFTIFGFDPDDDECQRLNTHYSSSNITAIPIALGRDNGEKNLYLTANPACSSIFQPDPWLNSNYAAFHCQIETGKTKIHVRRLDDWAKEKGIDTIDYLKTDTQGSDFDVLQGAGEFLPKIRCIQVEVMFNPMYLEQPLFADIDNLLRSKGFVLWRFSELTHYSKNKKAEAPINTDIIKHDDWNAQTTRVYAGQLFWGNAYYVNQSVLDDEATAEQKLRDEILFSSIGLPDVLGDQQKWNTGMAKRIEKFRPSPQEGLSSLADALALAKNAQIRAAAAEMDTRQIMAQLHAVHASTSWRMTAPLRWTKSAMRSLKPGGLKPAIKTLLQHAALYIGQRPRLKRVVLHVLNRIPTLKARLVRVAMGVTATPHTPPQAYSADVRSLPPRARKIYTDLKSALAKQQQEKI